MHNIGFLPSKFKTFQTIFALIAQNLGYTPRMSYVHELTAQGSTFIFLPNKFLIRRFGNFIGNSAVTIINVLKNLALTIKEHRAPWMCKFSLPKFFGSVALQEKLHIF